MKSHDEEASTTSRGSKEGDGPGKVLLGADMVACSKSVPVDRSRLTRLHSGLGSYAKRAGTALLMLSGRPATGQRKAALAWPS